MTQYYDITQLKNALCAQKESLIYHLFGDKKIARNADEWRVGTSGSLYIRPDGTFYCFETRKYGDILSLICYALGASFKEALCIANTFADASHTTQKVGYSQPASKHSLRKNQIAKAQRLWQRCYTPASIDDEKTHIVKTYLMKRGITLSRYPDDMRYHPNHYNFTSELSHPTMICAVRDSNNIITALHRTYFDDASHKISGEKIKPKLLVGTMSDGAIKLAPARKTLALCEGIEDALSIMQMLTIPCWATAGTSNIPTLPDSVDTVLLCPDADNAGKGWLDRAAAHYSAIGLAVKRYTMPDGVKDANALLQMLPSNASE